MIRQAAAEDVPAVITLWRECGLSRPWNDPDRDAALALATSTSAILVTDGEPLRGTVTVGFDGHRGWVYYLAVAPAARRQGIGRALMVAAEAWLRGQGAPKLQLMVRDGNADALAFYERLGLERQPVVTLGRFLEDR